MAAVNAAWAALRDPASRAAYDCHLAGGTRADTTGTAPPPGPAPRATHPPALHEAAPGCLTSLAGVGPWIAVLVVLAVIFVFTAYAANDDDDPGGDRPATETSMRRVRDLRGSCIGLANGATIVGDCFTVPHEGVIVAQASVGAACPEGTREWLIRQQDVLACTEPGSEVREP